MSRKMDTGPDYSRFSVNSESSIVATRPLEAVQIIQIIDTALNRSKTSVMTILDATGHVGTDTVNFALHWKDACVHVYEKDPVVFKLLETNVQEFGLLSRVVCRNQSSVDALVKCTTESAAKKTDSVTTYTFMYFDPPWGGKVYKRSESVKLALDDQPIETIIDAALDRGHSKLAVIKAPLNWRDACNLRHPWECHVVTKEWDGHPVPSFMLYIITVS